MIWHNRFSVIALPGLLIALIILAGCGSHGKADPLGQSARATLSAGATSIGSATITPFHATRVVAYYQGKPIPAVNAQTPVVVRGGSCDGTFVGAVTDGVAAAPGQNASAVAPQPAPGGGAYLAAAPSENLYVVILSTRDDASASILACGHPLSGLRQYFGLFAPGQMASGIAEGTALTDPTNATNLKLALDHPLASRGGWAIHSGSCTGPAVATGPVPAGQSTIETPVFRAFDAGQWWISVTEGSQTSCGQLSV